MKSSRLIAWVSFFTLMLALLIWGTDRQPEPPRQSELPAVTVQAEPVHAIVHEKIARPARHYAPFCEPLLGRRCWYNDRDLVKVGPRGLKPYEWPDVIVGDEP